MSALEDAFTKNAKAGIKSMFESMLRADSFSFSNLSTSAVVRDDGNAFTAKKMRDMIGLVEALGPRPPTFESIACKSVESLSGALERLTGQPVEEVEKNEYSALGWRVVERDYIPENKAMLVGRNHIAMLDLETGEIKTAEIQPLRFMPYFAGMS